MVKNRLVNLLFVMILPFIIFAQDSKPATFALTFEVLNTSLKTSKEPQNIKIRINCDEAQDLEIINLKMPQIKAIWSLVSAKLNDQSLWLIKSENISNNSNVLAWDLSAQDSGLILYPKEWPDPYALELEIQLNLKDVKDFPKGTAQPIIMEAVIAGGSYQCSPTGRGNQLRMQ